MVEKIEIDGVELILSEPDEISNMKWIGGELYINQLLAAWSKIDANDIPLNPQILGKPGTGKTTLAYSAGKLLNLPMYIFQCTMDTRPEDLLITPVIAEDNSIKYHASSLVSSMIKGGVCILDEANRMAEKSWASLAPLLDSRRYVESIIAGIKIKAHPNFRVCVTMNEDSSTFEVPEYIHSRLQPQIFIEFPDAETEFKVLKYNVPYTPQQILEYVRDFLQYSHEHNDPFSVRDGVNICRYYIKHYGPVNTAILKTLSENKDKIRTIQETTIKEIKELTDLMILAEAIRSILKTEGIRNFIEISRLRMNFLNLTENLMNLLSETYSKYISEEAVKGVFEMVSDFMDTIQHSQKKKKKTNSKPNLDHQMEKKNDRLGGGNDPIAEGFFLKPNDNKINQSVDKTAKKNQPSKMDKKDNENSSTNEQFFGIIKDLESKAPAIENMEKIKQKFSKLIEEIEKDGESGKNAVKSQQTRNQKDFFNDLLDPESFDLENATENKKNKNDEDSVKNKMTKEKNDGAIEIEKISNKKMKRKKNRPPFFDFDEYDDENPHIDPFKHKEDKYRNNEFMREFDDDVEIDDFRINKFDINNQDEDFNEDYDFFDEDYDEDDEDFDDFDDEDFDDFDDEDFDDEEDFDEDYDEDFDDEEDFDDQNEEEDYDDQNEEDRYFIEDDELEEADDTKTNLQNINPTELSKSKDISNASDEDLDNLLKEIGNEKDLIKNIEKFDFLKDEPQNPNMNKTYSAFRFDLSDITNDQNLIDNIKELADKKRNEKEKNQKEMKNIEKTEIQKSEKNNVERNNKDLGKNNTNNEENKNNIKNSEATEIGNRTNDRPNKKKKSNKK